MLNPEQAKKELERFYDRDRGEKIKEALEELPGNLKKIGKTLFIAEREQFFPNLYLMNADGDKMLKAWAELDSLKSEDRVKIFQAVFPKLSHSIEEMWHFTKGLPYQSSFERKAFRSPDNPNLTLHCRIGVLSSLTMSLQCYDEDITWLAAWASYIPEFQYQIHSLAPLFAASIDSGKKEGEEVFRILMETAKGEHEIGVMGRHVTTGLLMASRPEGWELMEKMLLAAQRQEGLRQTILESVDEAHPVAFRRMVELICENDLLRFSSVVRAVDVWFGFMWEVGDAKRLKGILDNLSKFIVHQDAVDISLKKGGGEELYIALWTMGFQNAVKSVKPAEEILKKDKDPERRFAAAYFLNNLGLDTAENALVSALEDPDLRIASIPLRNYLHEVFMGKSKSPGNLFSILEKQLPRFPDKEETPEPLLWHWFKTPVSKDMLIGAMISNMGKNSPSRLIPYLPVMGSSNRYRLAAKLGEIKVMDKETREVFFNLAGDSSAGIRETAFKKLTEMKVDKTEAVQLENYLSRKSADLRRGAIRVLLNQPDEDALASIKRLVSHKDINKRAAGLEILREMWEKERKPGLCREIAEEYKKNAAKLSVAEETCLKAILESEDKKPVEATLENALGLKDPEKMTKPTPPVSRNINTDYGAAMRILKSLDILVEKYQNEVVEIENYDGSTRKELLGNLRWGFPVPRPGAALEEDMTRLPLKDVWTDWWRNRPAEMRDKDGLELLRAMTLLLKSPANYLRNIPQWQKNAAKKLFPAVDREADRQFSTANIIQWFLCIDPPHNGAEFLLDGIETALSMVPASELIPKKSDKPYMFVNDWRFEIRTVFGFPAVADVYRTYCPNEWNPEEINRYWMLMKWMDEPIAGKGSIIDGLTKMLTGNKDPKNEKMGRFRPSFDLVLAAYKARGAGEADLYDYLMGPHQGRYNELWTLSSRKGAKEFEKCPILMEMLKKCRDRILEVELNRGDLPTAASEASLSLRFTGGMDVFISFLKALGKDKFIRGWTYDNKSKSCTFSHIIRASFPGKDETAKEFTNQVRKANIKENRLMEGGVFAPQWSKFIEESLEWTGYSSGVWWIHAHTKDTGWTVDLEIREAWNAEVNSFTPLTGHDLLSGAVDVNWFREVLATMGEEHWSKLLDAAKYASGGKGHTRAQLFAKAMAGDVSRQELITKINDKRNQDVLRALGLLPLENGENREKDLLSRYEICQEFLRTSKQFGSQKQASESLAVRIALENLARTAGYKDPIRLEWAMEAKAVEDLSGGGMTVKVDDVEISLIIDVHGNPEVKIVKNDKELKALPAKLKKNQDVIAIKERASKLKRQSSRMRKSLEEAMCRGDVFSGKEIREFAVHPLLSPMIKKMVFTGEGLMGYPDTGGSCLVDYDGRKFKLDDSVSLRIAHPHDFLKTGEWSKWQAECFERERKQPFKQVFRELYVYFDGESEDGKISNRYSGHQLQPRKAHALLGGRGWVSHPEEGTRKTFHDEKITVNLDMGGYFFTPAEVEDITIEGIHFTKAGEWEPLKLKDIPPRLFSEVMRDMDLVVSVAHSGGVDPEASMSTIEMRAALVKGAMELMKIDNVEIKDRWALIEGELSSYSVHLGSGTVHKMPGSYLCIIPVHSQHRGRIFLPFADDDPKTAEVLSKIIMLAKDKKIKDPTVLEQIMN